MYAVLVSACAAPPDGPHDLAWKEVRELVLDLEYLSEHIAMMLPEPTTSLGTVAVDDVPTCYRQGSAQISGTGTYDLGRGGVRITNFDLAVGLSSCTFENHAPVSSDVLTVTGTTDRTPVAEGSLRYQGTVSWDTSPGSCDVDIQIGDYYFEGYAGMVVCDDTTTYLPQ